MPLHISLNKSQLKDLEAFITLSAENINQIANAIKSLPTPPLRTSGIKGAIEKALPNRVAEVDAVVRQLISLYSIKRSADVDAKELFDGLCFSIENAEEPWPDEKINELRALEPVFIDLFSLSEVLSVVKALSLSYDYANVYQSAKILADIRPVYNEDATDILGAVVSHTLRLYYLSMEGQKSISIALDKEDVRMLLKSCERAITKANTAQRFMKDKAGKETIIRGEEN